MSLHDATFVVWAFPGQGIRPEALTAVLEAHEHDPLVVALRAATDAPAWAEVDYRDTSIGQPALFTAGVLRARATTAPRPRFVLGHSLGELTALAVAGAIDPDDGLRVVRARALAAQAAPPGAMVAVMGLDETQVDWLRREAIGRTRGVLEIAAHNGRQQIVLSGDTATVDALVDRTGEAGGLAQRLAIGGGFHSPLMLGATGPYRDALDAVDIRPPTIPWLSTIDLVAHRDPDAIRSALERALVLPVRWLPALELLATEAGESGEDHAVLVDIGPDAVLAKLTRRTELRVRSVALDDAESRLDAS